MGIGGVDTTRVAAAAEALADAVEQGRVTPGDDARSNHQSFDLERQRLTVLPRRGHHGCMAEQAGSGVLEWKGRTGPSSLEVDPTVFAPTHTSRTLADALEIESGDVVIDVGCGSGVLSFVAARLGAARVYGVDLSPQAVEIARRNAEKLGLQDRVEFRVGNLLEPVRELRANVIIGDVSGIPDEIAAVSGWFPDGRAGGPTGAEPPRGDAREHPGERIARPRRQAVPPDRDAAG